MLRPSFMMTPAPKKPMPVTTPCTTRVGSACRCPAVPPYHSDAWPTNTVSAAEAMQTSP